MMRLAYALGSILWFVCPPPMLRGETPPGEVQSGQNRGAVPATIVLSNNQRIVGMLSIPAPGLFPLVLEGTRGSRSFPLSSVRWIGISAAESVLSEWRWKSIASEEKILTGNWYRQQEMKVTLITRDDHQYVGHWPHGLEIIVRSRGDARRFLLYNVFKDLENKGPDRAALPPSVFVKEVAILSGEGRK